MELRKVTTDDAGIILDWRNDEITRKNSFSSEIIALEDHVKWLERKLTDPDCHMYILEDEGRAVGNIRFDVLDNGNVAEISYMVSPNERGHGYGKKILLMADDIVKPLGVKVLTGLVKEDNIASRKCFEAAGYSAASAGTIVSYIKAI